MAVLNLYKVHMEGWVRSEYVATKNQGQALEKLQLDDSSINYAEANIGYVSKVTV